MTCQKETYGEARMEVSKAGVGWETSRKGLWRVDDLGLREGRVLRKYARKHVVGDLRSEVPAEHSEVVCNGQAGGNQGDDGQTFRPLEKTFVLPNSIRSTPQIALVPATESSTFR